MKLLVALSLLVCEADANSKLVTRVEELETQAEVMKGLVQCLSEATAPVCDETCADVIAISSRPFPTIESGTRYEVGGCVEIKILRRVRAESSRRPPRHRRAACSMTWRCRFLIARRVDFHTGRSTARASGITTGAARGSKRFCSCTTCARPGRGRRRWRAARTGRSTGRTTTWARAAFLMNGSSGITRL